MGRPRKELPKNPKTYRDRFAVHLRSLVGTRDPHQVFAVMDVSEDTVNKWMGGMIPDPARWEEFGECLGLSDYRLIFPPAKRRRK
jgi:hypothetical protein